MKKLIVLCGLVVVMSGCTSTEVAPTNVEDRSQMELSEQAIASATSQENFAEVNDFLSLDKDTNIWLMTEERNIQLTKNGGTTEGCKDGKKLIYSKPVISVDSKYLLMAAHCEGEELEFFIKKLGTSERYSLGRGTEAELTNDGSYISIHYYEFSGEIPNPFIEDIDPNVDYIDTALAHDYSFVYLPLSQEQAMLQRMSSLKRYERGILLFGLVYIGFSPYELVSGTIVPYKDTEEAEDDRRLSRLFQYGYIEDLVTQIVRKVEVRGEREFFIEEFRYGTDRCLYFTQRLNDDFVVLFSECGLKAVLDPAIKGFLSKEELLVKLETLEAERLVKIKKAAQEAGRDTYYYAAFNSIRSYSLKNDKEEVLAYHEIPNLDSTRVGCLQLGEQPIMLCRNYDGYEQFEASGELFFLHSKRFARFDDCMIPEDTDYKMEEGHFWDTAFQVKDGVLQVTCDSARSDRYEPFKGQVLFDLDGNRL